MALRNIIKKETNIRNIFSSARQWRFGKYSIVKPGKVSPALIIPDNIPKPSYYVSGEPTEVIENVEIKTKDQIKKMRKSCKLAANILETVGRNIKIGQTTDEIDKFVHKLAIENGAYPSPYNYWNFPKSVCTSINNVACHGIPDDRLLEDGDVINIDITVFLDGYHGDCSKTFLVGSVDDYGKALVNAAENSLYTAIEICKPDCKFQDVGSCISKYCYKLGYTIIPAFIGHGLGSYFHGPPDIFHTVNNYPGVMANGMTFTIEPILGQGTEVVEILEDGWTAITTDGSRTAQFEHTVLITNDSVEILTLPD